MNSPMNTLLVDRAIIFATKAHHDTERRGKGFPYIIHPLEAMTIVATMTNDSEMLAAAVLHDTIEDTDATFDDIKREFGERVAFLVANETDVKQAPDGQKLPWKDRKQRDLDNLRNASREVKIIALGDKLSNMRAIARDYHTLGDSLWQMFHIKDKATHAWRYRSLRDALGELSDTFAFQEFDRLVNDTFGQADTE